MSTATLKNYRQSPRKVRLVADLVRGKSVENAENILIFAGKRFAPELLKLIKSAVANALNSTTVSKDSLYIKTVTVDKGMVYKRIMPRARGSASPIKKKTSIIKVELGIKEPKVKRSKQASRKEKMSEIKQEVKTEIKN